jgi:beta-galactosidase
VTGGTARIWSERVRLGGAAAVQVFEDGPDAGHPAVTRNALGAGTAWYVATAIDPRELLREVLDRASVTRPRGLPDALELVRRGPYTFVLNHGDSPVAVPGVHGADLLTGSAFPGEVPAGGVAVVKEAP